jgi:hypothetical protein
MSEWSLRPEGHKGYGTGRYKYTDEDTGNLEMISFGALHIASVMGEYIAGGSNIDKDCFPSMFYVLETLLEPINYFFQDGLHEMLSDAEARGRADAGNDA